jgi:hypothetical protein
MDKQKLVIMGRVIGHHESRCFPKTHVWLRIADGTAFSEYLAIIVSIRKDFWDNVVSFETDDFSYEVTPNHK